MPKSIAPQSDEDTSEKFPTVEYLARIVEEKVLGLLVEHEFLVDNHANSVNPPFAYVWKFYKRPTQDVISLVEVWAGGVLEPKLSVSCQTFSIDKPDMTDDQVLSMIHARGARENSNLSSGAIWFDDTIKTPHRMIKIPEAFLAVVLPFVKKMVPSVLVRRILLIPLAVLTAIWFALTLPLLFLGHYLGKKRSVVQSDKAERACDKLVLRALHDLSAGIRNMKAG